MSNLLNSLTLILALTLIPATGQAHTQTQTQPRDVFGQIQDNSWYLKTADGAAHLYVTQIGDGAPVVFLHGGPGNDFNYVIDALRPHLDDARFVLFDQRGSLLSPVTTEHEATLSLDTLVTDLETLRIALGEEKLVLFGHSWGSLLALSYYQKHPDRVEKLILTGSFPVVALDGISGMVPGLRTRQRAAMSRPEIADVVRQAGLAETGEKDTPLQAYQRRRITSFAANHLVNIDRWRNLPGGGVFYSSRIDGIIGNTLPATFDFRPTITNGGAEIAVIQGDQDYIEPAGASWTGVAKTTLTVAPNAGHYPWIDNPEVFARAFVQALAK